MTNPTDPYNTNSEIPEGDNIIAPLPAEEPVLADADAWLNEEPTRAPLPKPQYSLQTGEIERVLVTPNSNIPMSDVPTWAGGGAPWNPAPVSGQDAKVTLPADEVETRVPTRRSVFSDNSAPSGNSNFEVASPTALPSQNYAEDVPQVRAPMPGIPQQSRPNSENSNFSYAPQHTQHTGMQYANTQDSKGIAGNEQEAFTDAESQAKNWEDIDNNPSSLEELTVEDNGTGEKVTVYSDSAYVSNAGLESKNKENLNMSTLSDAAHQNSENYSLADNSSAATSQLSTSHISPSNTQDNTQEKTDLEETHSEKLQSEELYPDGSHENEESELLGVDPNFVSTSTPIEYQDQDLTSQYTRETDDAKKDQNTYISDATVTMPTAAPSSGFSDGVEAYQELNQEADSLFDVQLKPKSRVADHLWGLLLTFIGLPVLWYLIADTAARLTIPNGNQWSTGQISILSLVEFSISILLLIGLIIVAKSSALGVILFGFIFFAAGLVPLIIPAQTKSFITENLQILANYNDFGANVVHHLLYTLGSGLLAIFGMLLITIGFTSIFARREGKAAGLLEAKIEQAERAKQKFQNQI